MAVRPRQQKKSETGHVSLEGQLLIAMPHMPDKRFARSVIYMCAHSEESAMGLILNQRADDITFTDLLENLKLIEGIDPEELPAGVADIPVQVGGPVEAGRGFVLHSADYFNEEATVKVGNRVFLTATIDVLKAIAQGEGPRRSVLALGYAGWSAGQLESELLANGWLHCPSDPDIIFDRDFDSKYDRALALIGVEPGHLVTQSGRA